MGDYNLSGLSSRSFEKLIQALAVKVLGAGTVVFGDGPDGGREATFEGRMDYPSKAEPWDGYCVIQAKFRQRTEGTEKDGKWALGQLEKELKDFADRKKQRRVPEYYIFATNVVLSPVPEKGSKDKVAALFHKYRKKMNVQGWRVWDFDQICTFLDNAADIRRANAAWITSGDVLASVFDELRPKRPDFLEVMTSFLARDLLRDQFANLEQAGHATEDKIPLARVFVDLPTTVERTAEPPKEDQPGATRVSELVATLVEAARDSLEAARLPSLGRNIQAGERWTDAVGPQPGRYVLVAGPGQGKTTVGQFACQLFRASLLRDRPPELLAAEVLDALADVEGHCEPGKLELPYARRFPVRIVLGELATALSKDPEISLLEYVATLIRRRTSREVSTEDLRTWLGEYPWLLVLDGLDEVPASTNRDDVLRKVEELWIDAAQCEADLLVLATTRPQGYNDDFSPKRYRHLWLAPLSVKRALAYAQRLVEVRYVGDEERQRKILGRLEQASGSDATARLMRSPLQVTILATLVDHTGPPPQDRWQLFNDYYEVIYRRERERDIPAAKILRDHRSNIDAIHHQVGLVLQLEAEQAGGTEAKLPADRFEGIVAARLQEEGYEGRELSKLHAAIIEAAAHRLVFLVGLEAGQVGFEIRSLQEFMAAQALMSGKDEVLQERLRRIAPISSWRNTFLFAAGRCFSQPDKEHFRETIFTLCEALNDESEGELAQAVLVGSQLALELLEDGVAREQPKYARLLAKCTCRLLEQPPTDIHDRLAGLAEDKTEKTLVDHLEQWLGRGVPASLAAWTTLFPLVGGRVGWARQLALDHWPQEAKEQLVVLQLPTFKAAQKEWVDIFEETVRNNHPVEIYSLQFGIHFDNGDVTKWPFSWLLGPGNSLAANLSIEIGRYDIRTHFVSLAMAKGMFQQWKTPSHGCHPAWRLLIEGRRFAIHPCGENLARVLRCMASVPTWFQSSSSLRFSDRFSMLPWVLAACLDAADSPEDAAALAERAADGDLGNYETWRAAEGRWQQKGATLEDLLWMSDDRWPLDKSIGTRGMVLGHLSVGLHREDSLGQLLSAVYSLSNSSHLQRCLGWIALFGLNEYRTPPTWLELSMFEHILDRTRIDPDKFMMIAEWALNDTTWLAFLDKIGRTALSVESHRHTMYPSRKRGEVFFHLFEGNSHSSGLLPFLAAIMLGLPRLGELEIGPIYFEDFIDLPVRRAALVLELGRGRLEKPRAAQLAREAREMLEEDSGLLWQVLQRAVEGDFFDESLDFFLLELLGHFCDDADWKRSGTILGALRSSFRRQRSELSNREVWCSLSLPEGLLREPG